MIDQGAVTDLHLQDDAPRGDLRRPARSYWRESWDRLLENRVGTLAGSVILFLAVVAILAPLVSAYVTHFDPTRQDLDSQFVSPNPRHWLGADEVGRDTFTRLVWGARVTLGIGFLAVALQLVVGGGVGLLAGFFRGWVDGLLMRVVDMVLAIPAIFLYILMSILFEPSTVTLALIIASVGWGQVARLVRGEVLTVGNRDFMLATRSLGASSTRLMLRHLLPNVLPVLIVAASLGVGAVVLAEAALDFLVVLPGVLIFVTVLAANVFGNAVRDAFDPRLR